MYHFARDSSRRHSQSLDVQVQLHQVDALLRKSVAFQKKNWAQNCCVIACPLVLIALLGVIQVLIDKLLDAPDAKVCVPPTDV